MRSIGRIAERINDDESRVCLHHVAAVAYALGHQGHRVGLRIMDGIA